MSNIATNVKEHAGRFHRWIDCHPRTGWYVAVIVTLDFIMHLRETL